MKKYLTVATALAILFTANFSGHHIFADSDLESSAPGNITFVGKNKVATANGTFHNWKFVTAKFDPENLDDSAIEIEVDIASLDTKWARRDNHLREEDFFYTEVYPISTLKIDSFKETGRNDEGRSLFTGTLVFTLRGIEKTYNDFTFSIGNERPVHVTGTFEVLRTDFKVGEPYTGLHPLSIEDEIKIAFDVKLPR